MQKTLKNHLAKTNTLSQEHYQRIMVTLLVDLRMRKNFVGVGDQILETFSKMAYGTLSEIHFKAESMLEHN